MNFRKKYFEAFPNEPTEISRELYGRRKFKVINSMTKKELVEDFKNNKYFGHKIKSYHTKDQIIKILKANSGFI